MIHTLKTSLITGAVAFAVGTAAGFASGWEVQGWRKDAQAAEYQMAISIAVSDQKAAQDAERVVRDVSRQLSAALAVERDQKKEIHEGTITEARIEYVKTDPNATECGLSERGVLVVAGAARGSPVSGEEVGATALDAKAIAAPNSEVVRVMTVSFARHWDALNIVDDLQAYIVDECSPL